MKAEAWIFGICTVFFILVAPAYWLIARDPTGTSALVMTALLTTLVTFYLGFHASKMDPRPEDRQDAEIAARGSSASSRRTAGGRCGPGPPWR